MTTQRLADFTTLRVGGPPDGLVTVTTTEQLVSAVRLSAELQQPILVVGGGSNLVVSDAGFPGTAVIVRSRGIDAHDHSNNRVRVDVAAGEPWDDFVNWAITHKLAGVETLSGIPGLSGATPIQNVGAYGQEIGNVIDSVQAIHRYTGEMRTFSADECEFAYRTSVFKQRANVFVVTSVRFVLRPSVESDPIRYAELASALGIELGGTMPLAAVRDAVLSLRRNKAMVLDDDNHDTWSAGSFFTNPLLAPELANALPGDAPRWIQPDGRVKTSAAWLIEKAGFRKGFGSGSARLSTKHVLAITNSDGEATAADIVELARAIRQRVNETFGVVLEPEPVLVGIEL